MTLIALGGVKVKDVATALSQTRHSSFGDGTGLWASPEQLGYHVPDGYYGPIRGCLNELERLGRARRHPSGADFWQPCRVSPVPNQEVHMETVDDPTTPPADPGTPQDDPGQPQGDPGQGDGGNGGEQPPTDGGDGADGDGDSQSGDQPEGPPSE